MCDNRWNVLNNTDDVVLVVDVASETVVFQNSLCNALIGSVGSGGDGTSSDNTNGNNTGSNSISGNRANTHTPKSAATALCALMPQQQGGAALLADALQFLQKDPTAEYQTSIAQQVLQQSATVQLCAGYLDDTQREIYLVCKGYQGAAAFAQLQQSLAQLPGNILLLEPNDQLQIRYVNQEFNQNFSTAAVPFVQHFGGSFLSAVSQERHEDVLTQIKQGLVQAGHCSFVTSLSTVAGHVHYVAMSVKYLPAPFEAPLLCATLQIADDTVGRYLQLQNENEVCSVAYRFSNSVLFRIDLKEMSAEFFGDLVDNFNLSNLQGEFAKVVIERNLVFQDDMEAFYALLRDMRDGVERMARMRMYANDGRCDWYLIEYKITKDADGVPQQALGKISNVQQTEELREKASRDSLTGCLNKGSFEALCTNLLNNSGGEATQAFLIIDIDDFKAVNDNLGHFFGDVVLKEIAAKLKRIFRTTDYIARIGGDEFAVLMRDVKVHDVISRKAEEIVQALDSTYRRDGSAYHVSASVGIATHPHHAQNYEDIYKRADIALYQAKHAGKNAYQMYDEAFAQGGMANTTPFDVANRAYSHFFDQEVAMDTFNLLFEANGSGEALNTVLHHLGEHFGVDRCYVFSATDETCTAYNNTYEWCRDGIPPEIENLQNVPYEAFDGLFAQANDDGVFYSGDVATLAPCDARDMLEAQGIVAVLHTYVRQNGRVKYALGFDDCTTTRMWKPSEISTLMYASKIISQFLLYTEAVAHFDQPTPVT